MALTDGLDGQASPRVRRVTATLTPDSRFPVPQSDGYSVYSALLSILSDTDEDVGSSVHDSKLGSLHCSGLQGRFGESDRPHHKTLLPGETYELSLGIVHPDDEAVFQALVNALVLEGESIELSHGSLTVERFESENASPEELLEQASEYDDPTVEITFETPTCIEESGEVTTMFPHRWAVFNSLQGKWNKSCPEDLELDLSREDVEAHVIEKPDPGQHDGYCLDTHSVLVNRVKNDDGENRNLFSQGFTGTCGYEFKGASESVENAVTALALFGEYSGIGSAVARGCGNVEVKIK
ncbi:CRISPR-Cas system related protein, RAMP superfamily Cas6 group [Halapricum desulfuricans]|uniref:CRISPR-Cas system related protein, RAMP superfamily Cas6 group n=1 Tax=Halapricum desulfuricans TaxID=2841257 RepID=A0A897NJ62_9EURY|nr:CRISPR system precrRNA processing endoribonuclease RAMP protein Cas6 [Halapricum desulfuricans]QSG11485.1 CRISPR-Cas system related protein, RAMP superfamily Cas6 group [Halapricum desulfuricans]